MQLHEMAALFLVLVGIAILIVVQVCDPREDGRITPGGRDVRFAAYLCFIIAGLLLGPV